RPVRAPRRPRSPPAAGVSSLVVTDLNQGLVAVPPALERDLHVREAFLVRPGAGPVAGLPELERALDLTGGVESDLVAVHDVDGGRAVDPAPQDGDLLLALTADNRFFEAVVLP